MQKLSLLFHRDKRSPHLSKFPLLRLRWQQDCNWTEGEKVRKRREKKNKKLIFCFGLIGSSDKKYLEGIYIETEKE